MTGFRDFLTRFRPVASPGRAVPGGVPTDRSAELRAELVPSLALLEQTERDASRVRERAFDAAASRVHEAEALAEEIVASARADARRVRERAAEAVLAAAEAEAAELLTEAEREAAVVRDRAAARTAALTDRALALVREDIAAEPGPAAPTEAGS